MRWRHRYQNDVIEEQNFSLTDMISQCVLLGGGNGLGRSNGMNLSVV